MVPTDADDDAEMRRAHPEGSGRKPPEQGLGASIATARPQPSPPEVEARLMEEIVSRANMMTAYRRVMANKGAAGIDRMTVEQLQPYLKEHWPRIKEELLEGRYRPQPVRGVEIPKPGGGVRQLGIPTVVDRLIQQAMHQVLMPLFDPGFSKASYGFRPGRSAHDAVLAARAHVAEGRRFVVDLDLEKFFDRVNHDVLMARVARRVADKRVLRLIRRYLRAGLMTGGITTARSEGTPQGGPLSPLLSNILLDDLDKELERRGHAFCRYADDCNIYVRTRRAGERVMASITRFLTERLRLKVNAAKSAVDRPWVRTFLGYTMTAHKQPRLRVAVKSVKRLRSKLRTTLRQGRGRTLASTVKTLTPILRGWLQYFRLAEAKGVFEELDGWMRRKLRCVLWRQWKRPRTRLKRLMQRGLDPERAWRSAYNGRGPWWNAGASHMNDAYRAAFFTQLGLPSFVGLHRHLNRA
ncbi:group II intron reverse transcriptase/maturase [Bradyrhizobium diazoefficiens]|nr:group II intron reverse transcriptase/maturase [Bradyrhizobium diazoefficiens]QQO33892.1 group II intron reverse transcriptase/maturase [Bradyrhizobium diazoefficiens]QQO35294.1 group II intron reverse transcriptase/maturase [Bradyrhizobium diazoefficiens]QQO37097.1 group II intron reverse transcriptase/maturase [Bradyrhizobium diazoefficiens]